MSPGRWLAVSLWASAAILLVHAVVCFVWRCPAP